MKTAVAAISTALALLLAGAAQAQPRMQLQIPPQNLSRMTDMRGGINGPGMMRPPVPPRQRPPSFVRSPFFGRHPFLFGSGYFFPTSEPAAPAAYAYDYPVPVQAPYALDTQPQPQYWAYCRSAQGYYPYVPECPGGWLPVVPTSTPPPAPTRLADSTEREVKQAPAGGMSIEELRERIAHSRAD